MAVVGSVSEEFVSRLLSKQASGYVLNRFQEPQLSADYVQSEPLLVPRECDSQFLIQQLSHWGWTGAPRQVDDGGEEEWSVALHTQQEALQRLAKGLGNQMDAKSWDRDGLDEWSLAPHSEPEHLKRQRMAKLLAGEGLDEWSLAPRSQQEQEQRTGDLWSAPKHVEDEALDEWSLAPHSEPEHLKRRRMAKLLAGEGLDEFSLAPHSSQEEQSVSRPVDDAYVPADVDLSLAPDGEWMDLMPSDGGRPETAIHAVVEDAFVPNTFEFVQGSEWLFIPSTWSDTGEEAPKENEGAEEDGSSSGNFEFGTVSSFVDVAWAPGIQTDKQKGPSSTQQTSKPSSKAGRLEEKTSDAAVETGKWTEGEAAERDHQQPGTSAQQEQSSDLDVQTGQPSDSDDALRTGKETDQQQTSEQPSDASLRTGRPDEQLSSSDVRTARSSEEQAEALLTAKQADTESPEQRSSDLTVNTGLWQESGTDVRTARLSVEQGAESEERVLTAKQADSDRKRPEEQSSDSSVRTGRWQESDTNVQTARGAEGSEDALLTGKQETGKLGDETSESAVLTGKGTASSSDDAIHTARLGEEQEPASGEQSLAKQTQQLQESHSEVSTAVEAAVAVVLGGHLTPLSPAREKSLTVVELDDSQDTESDTRLTFQPLKMPEAEQLETH